MRGSSAKFSEYSQRIIVVEGLLETALDLVAKNILNKLPNTVVIPVKPDYESIPEFAEKLFQLIEENPNKIIIFNHLTLGERLKSGTKVLKEIKLLEEQLSELPTFAFFCKATMGYFLRQSSNQLSSSAALDIIKKQDMLEAAYQSSGYTRKLYLIADGSTTDSLANTVLYQSHLFSYEVTPWVEEDILPE